MPRPFKLKAPRVPETDLHQNVVDGLAKLVAPPAEWTTFPAGHIKLSPRDGAKLRRLGLKPSWPDLLVLHGQRIYGIELKADGGKLSKTRIVRSRKTGRARIVEGQTEVFPRLKEAGMLIVTCGSLDDVLVALRTFGVPLRISAGSELVEKIA